MAAKLTRLSHKIAIQLHLVAESCTICSSRSRRPVRKLLDTLSYMINDSMEQSHSSEADSGSIVYSCRGAGSSITVSTRARLKILFCAT
jgi:hypothetical protein